MIAVAKIFSVIDSSQPCGGRDPSLSPLYPRCACDDRQSGGAAGHRSPPKAHPQGRADRRRRDLRERRGRPRPAHLGCSHPEGQAVGGEVVNGSECCYRSFVIEAARRFSGRVCERVRAFFPHQAFAVTDPRALAATAPAASWQTGDRRSHRCATASEPRLLLAQATAETLRHQICSWATHASRTAACLAALRRLQTFLAECCDLNTPRPETEASPLCAATPSMRINVCAALQCTCGKVLKK